MNIGLELWFKPRDRGKLILIKVRNLFMSVRGGVYILEISHASTRIAYILAIQTSLTRRKTGF